MQAVPRDRFGGIVLCGGKSERMGRPKLLLPFGDETMLARVVRIVGQVVSPVVVVAACATVICVAVMWPFLPGRPLACSRRSLLRRFRCVAP